MRVLILLRGFDSLKKHEVGNFELDQAKALAAIPGAWAAMNTPPTAYR